MQVDPNLKYFMMSFRFNKTKPQDFGLLNFDKDSKLFIDDQKAIWKQQGLYDFGWGKEYGYIRIPELSFEELWSLLCFSDLEINKYGAAAEIEEKYSNQLLDKLLIVVDDQNTRKNINFIEIARILKLHDSTNKSSIIGKTFEQIEEDHKKWKYISTKI